MAAPALHLESLLSDLPKVRASEVRAFERLGLKTVNDLLLHLPSGWESYGEPVPVGGLRDGEHQTVVGVLAEVSARRTPRRAMKLTEAVLIDDRGGRLKLVWFNQPYLANSLRLGDRLAVAGVARLSRYGPGFTMQNPHHEVVPASTAPRRIGGLMPKYRLSKGLSARKIADFVQPLLPLAADMVETLPLAARLRRRLPSVEEAVRWGHRPETEAEWHLARSRMAFAELFELQMAFAIAARRLEQEPAVPVPYRQEVIDAFKAGVGFALTNAQRRTTWDIFRDIARPTPMNRLLNGDVGAGKTAVAAAAVAMTHAAGLQSVVMAPTEILARQHLGKFRAYLEGSFPDLTVELLVSGQSAAERRRVTMAVASNQVALVVGTHALIEDRVEIPELGLAVVDEQHRFGTRQRELLRSKGRGRPHFLAMTATPIPRSLALALYGEMALSFLDELPPGRSPVRTEIVLPGGRQRAYELVRREIRAGRQAFVICPLVEESETLDVKAATVEYERLKLEVFGDLRLALVHGRMKDKDVPMRAFAAGEVDVLVATAVVEVGVDVPNATVMLIEGAERFGLAQLHQFRGRVGRGGHEAHCLLLPDDASEKALERLAIIAQENNGFRLAEDDMRMRGVGEMMGPRQHGVSDVAMQALTQPTLLNEVRQEAERLLEEDPLLEGLPSLRDAVLRRLDQTSIS
ncbi:MAG: ATP-dependent DNA helicase RecG [Candidatus Dormibacteraeota bacterium]|nr:ATP-dependent DNA helicase RecG [Candidatus Dormibacteraeota bacterium]